MRENEPIQTNDGNFACPKCGREIVIHQRRCNHCGLDIDWTDFMFDPVRYAMYCEEFLRVARNYEKIQQREDND